MLNISDLTKIKSCHLHESRPLPFFEHQYFRIEGNQLKNISFSEFVQLPQTEKQEVLNILNRAIKEGIPCLHLRHKIQQIRNVIFTTLQAPSDQSQINKDLWSLILNRTTPKTVAECKAVSRRMQEVATGKAQILSLNRMKLPMQLCLPPKRTTVEQALDWLESTGHSALLEWADFRDFGGNQMNRENLQRLFALCPNIKFLAIKGYQSMSLPELPQALEVFHFSDFIGGPLPPLPKTLRALHLINNHSLTTLPLLPATLQTLECINISNLQNITHFPDSLREIRCYNTRLENPPPFPQNLKALTIGATPIRILGPLPEKLESLVCSNNSLLQGLPFLPTTLKALNCSDNPSLKALPPLPEALRELVAHGCQALEKLPRLPASLQVLDCYRKNSPLAPPNIPKALRMLNNMPYPFVEEPEVEIPKRSKSTDLSDVENMPHGKREREAAESKVEDTRIVRPKNENSLDPG